MKVKQKVNVQRPRHTHTKDSARQRGRMYSGGLETRWTNDDGRDARGRGIGAQMLQVMTWK